MEYFMNWSRTLIAARVHENFKNVARTRTTVCKGVTGINCHTIDEPFVLGKLAVDYLKFVSLLVQCPEFDCIIMGCNEFVPYRVIKLDILTFLLKLGRCWATSLRATFGHVPNYDLVTIPDTTKGY